MMEKIRSTLLTIALVLTSLCFTIIIFAETIVLKSGERIEGKIIEKTDEYIKIDFHGVAVPYYFEDIDRIEGETSDIPLSPSSKEANIVGNKGITLINEGKMDEGLELIKQATQIAPEDASWHMNYASMLFINGQALIQAGNRKEGEAIFKEVEKELLLAINLYKEDENMLKSQCYFLLGDVYFYAFEDKEKAKTFYQNALEHYSEHGGAIEALKRFKVEKEKAELHFDSRNWQIGYQASNSQQSIVEYVLEGETVHNWSELVSAQGFFGLQKQTSPGEFMESTKKMITEQCPQAVWNVISKGDNDVMYEWEITNFAGQDDQHEIARMILGKEGIHVIHYATKKIPISPNRRQEWIKLLNSVTLAGSSQENTSEPSLPTPRGIKKKF